MESGRKKVLFVIPELTGGGAERILVEIIRNLDPAKYAPSLLLFKRSGRFLDEVPGSVPVSDINESRHYRAFGILRILYKLYRTFRRERPDLVFSVINTASFLAIPAARMARLKVIAYEVSNPFLDVREEFAYPRVALGLLRLTYPRAHLLLCLSKGIKESLVRNLGIPEWLARVSYTPFDIEYIERRSGAEVGHPWFNEDVPVITGIGTLIRRKGFEDLIRALERVRTEMGPVRLVLLGEGPMKNELAALADDLGIGEDVYFAGFQDNPWKFLARSDAFVLSSLHEGLGNVIIEALICSVPVVSTDCPIGPAEILKDGECGLLVPTRDPVAMAGALVRVLNDELLRKDLTSKGRLRAMDFERRHVIRRLEGIIDGVIGSSK